MTTATLKIAGISDDVTTCECCGRTDLKRTIALMDDDGNVRHLGSMCAALELGRGGRKAARKIETEAINVRPVVAYAVRNLTTGAYIKNQADGRIARFDAVAAEARAARIKANGMEAVQEPLYA